MKKTKIACLLLVTLPLLLQSCLKDQDDIFSESASARMSNYLKNAADVLVGADNGWVLNYYPSRTQAYGGYAYTMKFDRQDVEVMTQLDNGATRYVSTYKLTNDDGPVLSFDTYNEAIHFFARPTASRYEGYDGDFEFIIMDISDDRRTITLKGKRTGNLMKMHQLDSSPESYLAATAAVQAAMPFQAYELNINNTKVYVDGQEGNLVMNYKLGDKEQALTVPYIFTPNGMEFYQAVNILGQEIKGVEYAEKPGGEPKIGDSFHAMDNTDIIFVSVPQRLNLQFIRGKWYVAYSTLGTYAAPYWNVVNRTMTQTLGEQLYYAYFGTDNGGYGLQFAATDGSQTFTAALFYEYGLQGDDGVTLGFAGTGYGEAGYYYQYANFAYALFPFGYLTSEGMIDPRTFKITVDNPERPKQLTLTEQDNADNTITLWSEPVYYPFDN